MLLKIIDNNDVKVMILIIKTIIIINRPTNRPANRRTWGFMVKLHFQKLATDVFCHIYNTNEKQQEEKLATAKRKKDRFFEFGPEPTKEKRWDIWPKFHLDTRRIPLWPGWPTWKSAVSAKHHIFYLWVSLLVKCISCFDAFWQRRGGSLGLLGSWLLCKRRRHGKWNANFRRSSRRG